MPKPKQAFGDGVASLSRLGLGIAIRLFKSREEGGCMGNAWNGCRGVEGVHTGSAKLFAISRGHQARSLVCFPEGETPSRLGRGARRDDFRRKISSDSLGW